MAWLQICEPTERDQGKYTFEIFDGKDSHQRSLDLSGPGAVPAPGVWNVACGGPLGTLGGRPSGSEQMPPEPRAGSCGCLSVSVKRVQDESVCVSESSARGNRC